MTVEEQRSVLYERAVRMLRKFGKPDDLVSCFSQGRFVAVVLFRGFCSVDRYSIEMSQLAGG